VSALRPFPCRETGSHIHRLEIPYGRFERRLALPPQAPIELVGKQLADGVLILSFRRKEGA
jgi:HSP20 family molecular chaperone IbpA